MSKEKMWLISGILSFGFGVASMINHGCEIGREATLETIMHTLAKDGQIKTKQGVIKYERD